MLINTILVGLQLLHCYSVSAQPVSSSQYLVKRSPGEDLINFGKAERAPKRKFWVDDSSEANESNQASSSQTIYDEGGVNLDTPLYIPHSSKRIQNQVKFWNDHLALRQFLNDSEKKMLHEIVYNQIKYEGKFLEGSHNRFYALLANLDAFKKEKIWEFVGKHKHMFPSLPHEPLLPAETSMVPHILWSRIVMRVKDSMVAIVMMKENDSMEMRKFMLCLNIPQYTLLYQLGRMWDQVRKDNYNTESVKSYFDQINLLLASLTDYQKKQFWKVENKKNKLLESFGDKDISIYVKPYLQSLDTFDKEYFRFTMDEVYPQSFYHHGILTEELWKHICVLLAASCKQKEQVIWKCISILLQAQEDHFDKQKYTTRMFDFINKVFTQVTGGNLSGYIPKLDRLFPAPKND